MADSTKPTNKQPRRWAPRIWLGCDFFAWLRILTHGRFRLSLPHLHIAFNTSVLSFGHFLLRVAQNHLYGTRIRQTPITKPPVFIVGHWRTGTTLLHELLILDPRHGYPNTYQCLEPNHFLLTEKIVKKWFGWMMPERRPMDNMKAGWDLPQEDEFALCMLGQPSPYLTIAFPNRGPVGHEALDLETLGEHERQQWKRAFYRFIQTLTYKDPRRLILKSPPHTARIPTLLELFPEARFIHIVRDPYVVYPSTVNLWRSLYQRQGMQNPHLRGIEEYVFSTFSHLYDKLEEGKKLVRTERFYEVKYEDLIANPQAQLRAMYEHLDLGDFALVEPQVQAYLSAHAHYETNKYQLTDAEREAIGRRWSDVIRRYGYDQSTRRAAA